MLIEKNPDIKINQELFSEKYEEVQNVICPKFIKLNSLQYRYRKGYFIHHQKMFCEINLLLKYGTKYSLLCYPYDINKFNKDSLLFEIGRAVNMAPFIIDVDKLEQKKCYESKILNGKEYITGIDLNCTDTDKLLCVLTFLDD